MKKFYAKGKVYRRWSKIYHNPTTGPGALELWRFANVMVENFKDGNILMRECGYIPYCGYPLKKIL